MSTTPAVSPEQVHQISLAQLKPSKLNARHVFDQASIDELAESITKQGILQPLTARPIGQAENKGAMRYEIVMGGRRYLAAQKVKLETVPVIIRQMSDDEVRDAVLVENIQRESLAPMDQAEEFGRRIKTMDIPALAALIGKDVTYVTRRLQLLHLVPEVRKALAENAIGLGHALEVCRLGGNDQKLALKWTLATDHVETRDGYKNVKSTRSVEQLRIWIHGNLILDLTKAPFDTTDITLNPKMGACGTCPHRTGGAPALFSDIKNGDLCTLPECFKVKAMVTIDRKVEAVREETGAKKVLRVSTAWGSYGRDDGKTKVDIYASNSSDYVKAGDECPATIPGVIVHRGSNASLGYEVGRKVQICQNGKCKKHHAHGGGGSKSVELTPMARANKRLANLRQRLPQLQRESIFDAIAEKVVKKDWHTFTPHQVKLMTPICLYAWSRIYGDYHRMLAQRLKLEPGKRSYGGKDWEGAAKKHFQGNELGLGLLTIAIDDVRQGPYSGSKKGDNLTLLAGLLKVDAEAIKAKVAKEVGEKSKAIRASAERSAAKAKKPKAPKAPKAKAAAAAK